MLVEADTTDSCGLASVVQAMSQHELEALICPESAVQLGLGCGAGSVSVSLFGDDPVAVIGGFPAAAN